MVFPTHVGVFPHSGDYPRICIRLPHARGGVSASWSACANPRVSSPRTWGCFSFSCSTRPLQLVFPTHVGVFLAALEAARTADGLPHARGGVSWVGALAKPLAGSSPRTWGCFFKKGLVPWNKGVFPTHVGVFPLEALGFVPAFSLPHARGGVSGPAGAKGRSQASSPRTWGCFYHVAEPV